MSEKLGSIMFRIKGTDAMYSYVDMNEDSTKYEKVHVLTPEELRGLLLNAFSAGIQAEISGPDFNHYSKELGL